MTSEQNSTQAVHQFIDQHQDQFLADLEAFLRIPSISALPKHAGDMQRAADFVSEQG